MSQCASGCGRGKRKSRALVAERFLIMGASKTARSMRFGSRDMAGLIVDILEEKHKKQKII